MTATSGLVTFPSRRRGSAGCDRTWEDERGERRSFMGLPRTDFESVPYAIPPLGRARKYTREKQKDGLGGSVRPSVLYWSYFRSPGVGPAVSTRAAPAGGALPSPDARAAPRASRSPAASTARASVDSGPAARD